MSVIYLEDIRHIASSKFLAVNIAAQRARQLNEKGIPILTANERKPAAVALEALVEGKIDYEEVDRTGDTSEDPLIFNPVVNEEGEKSEELEELQPGPYVDDTSQESDDSVEGADEIEEGL